MKWNQMIPELDVFNLAESLHFYTNIIGFKIVYNREEDKILVPVKYSLNKKVFNLNILIDTLLVTSILTSFEYVQCYTTERIQTVDKVYKIFC